jgi:cell division protein FtsZ
MEGAKGLLLNVTGGADLALSEISEAADIVSQAADPEAHIIFGAVIDSRLENEVKLTVIATGFDMEPSGQRATPGFRARSLRSPYGTEQGGPTDSDRGRYQPADDRDRDRSSERDRGPIRVGSIGGTNPEINFENEDDLDIPPFLRRRSR